MSEMSVRTSVERSMEKIPAKLHHAGTRRSRAHKEGGVSAPVTEAGTICTLQFGYPQRLTSGGRSVTQSWIAVNVPINLTVLLSLLVLFLLALILDLQALARLAKHILQPLVD